MLTFPGPFENVTVTLSWYEQHSTFSLVPHITFNPTVAKLCTIYLDNNIQHQQETKQEHNPALQ